MIGLRLFAGIGSDVCAKAVSSWENML